MRTGVYVKERGGGGGGGGGGGEGGHFLATVHPTNFAL